ncbi:hypothetical protein [Gimesia aquarii]|uniref:Carboxypeptidase regulatory-like domain-containing protein n=1 Tax=Gimesia aquarii TaxID=2527964 RepID=A0A517VUE3_9PLAN|nr:hypothetical protein [Gimesia aquarii]QDT96625.1 hypothetical protein V144x_20830 [Gimesia aquarii]
MIRSVNILLLLFAITISGCGGDDAAGSKRTVKTVPASGTLTLDDKPFGPIHIDLLPIEKKGDNVRTAKADVNADGTFVLGTYEEADGAAPGNYRVVLGNMGENLMEPPPAVQDTQVLVPEGGGDSIKIILKSAGKDAGAGSLLNPTIKKAK